MFLNDKLSLIHNRVELPLLAEKKKKKKKWSGNQRAASQNMAMTTLKYLPWGVESNNQRQSVILV